jgi:hypothetical protein
MEVPETTPLLGGDDVADGTLGGGRANVNCSMTERQASIVSLSSPQELHMHAQRRLGLTLPGMWYLKVIDGIRREARYK